jgi:hypothetical protein
MQGWEKKFPLTSGGVVSKVRGGDRDSAKATYQRFLVDLSKDGVSWIKQQIPKPPGIVRWEIHI